VPLDLPRALNDERVSVVPSEVDAALHVRENDDTLTFDSLPVWPTKPPDLDEKYKVVYNVPLRNVTLVGPKDQIDQVRTSGKSPGAVFRVTDQDVGARRTRKVEFLYEGLPPDVRVKDEDRFTVDFELQSRSATE